VYIAPPFAFFDDPDIDGEWVNYKEEQIRACFKPVLDGIMEMAQSQISEIKRKGGSLKVSTTCVAILHSLTEYRQL
jgi:hypothetical protein